MKLVKEQCKREGFEKYTDLFLCFTHEGKDYKVRVRPLFAGYYDLLVKVAKHE